MTSPVAVVAPESTSVLIAPESASTVVSGASISVQRINALVNGVLLVSPTLVAAAQRVKFLTSTLAVAPAFTTSARTAGVLGASLSVAPSRVAAIAKVIHASASLTVTPVITGTATKLVISFDAAAYYPTAINSYPNATSLSWTHTATAGAYVIVDVVTDRVGITSVKYGGSNGTAMTQALSVNLGNDGTGTSGTYARFVLANVVGGAQTVYVTFPATAIWTAAGSVSYTNVVSSFSTASPVT